MRGDNGIAGQLGRAFGGETDHIMDLGLDASQITTLFGTNNLSLSSFDTFQLLAFNDNDDIWGASLWIETQADGIVRGDIIELQPTPNDPSSATIKLDLTSLDLSEVYGIGITINADFLGGNHPSATDAFHMSYSAVPEPGTLLLLGFGLLSVAGYKKTRS